MKAKDKFYYLSLQYSGIQRVVLRHDRLWSIAGLSQIMAEINEIKMQHCIGKKGKVLIAGGGKFTARFESKEDAEDSKRQIIKLISTALPMLEFQVSDVFEAQDFNDAREKGIIKQLIEKKRLRGYGVSFNPHLQTCSECGEYPALDFEIGDENVCSICNSAYSKARIDIGKILRTNQVQERNELTTLERIYKRYFESCYSNRPIPNIPYNFEDLYSSKYGDDTGKRMAVWFSDLNNMNQKVPIWLSESDEKISEIFSVIKDLNIEIISQALIDTFPAVESEYLPFRLIVGGGDDLRIVMAEEYILDFVCNLSENLKTKVIEKINQGYDFLSEEWLESKRKEYTEKMKKQYAEANIGLIDEADLEKPIKPYSFGGAFVITAIHTPFRKIHEACEELMAEAKEKTERRDNSVNWAILSVEKNRASQLIKFHKPLFIEDQDNKDELSFRKYIKMYDFYSPIISGSHIQQIAEKIIEYKNDSSMVEKWLKLKASATLEKSFEFLLVDKNLRQVLKEDGDFDCRRLSTLLELLTIPKRGK